MANSFQHALVFLNN